MEIVNRIKRNFGRNYYVGENNYGKEILVVVDAQNDFITGALWKQRSCDVATNVIAEEIRSGKYDDVIFTRDTHDENYLNTQEGKKLPVTHCIKWTNGWEMRRSS